MLLISNVTTKLIIVGVGRLLYLVGLFLDRGDLERVYDYRNKSKFHQHALQETIYRVLLQLPFILLGILHEFLAVVICAYSILAGNAHFLQAFRRQKREKAKQIREESLGTTLSGSWGVAPRSFLFRVSRKFQRVVWLFLGLLLPAIAVLYALTLGSTVYLVGILLGFALYFVLYPRRLHYPLVEMIQRRRGGWWGKLAPGMKVGFCLVLIGVPLASGAYIVYSVTPVRSTKMVMMRDGTRLATDVYLPRFQAGPFPVLLVRTPYNKVSDFIEDLGTLYANYGFAVVVQDMRGRFASEGVDEVFRYDDVDGVDTIAWIREQS